MDQRLEQLRSRVEARVGDAQGQIDSGFSGLWFFRLEAPARPRRKTAPTLFVAFILQGKKRMRLGRLDLVYTPGEYLVVTGETEYEAQVIGASASQPYLSLAVEVPPELVIETLIALSDVEGNEGEDSPAYVSQVDPPLLDVLSRLLDALDDDAERRVVGPLVLRELVFRLLRSEAAGILRRAVKRTGDETRIQEAMEFIRANVARRLTVEEIARHVAMSTSHFAHRFRDLTRVSPMRYVKHVRLHRARQLLVGEGMRAGEAATRVGYQSASHFTRDFKSYFGTPPGSYARRALGATA